MYHIAIIEDELEGYENLCKNLHRYTKEYSEEFHITHFKNVIQLLNDYKPVYDFIFMDIELPFMNGMEGSRKLRELDQSVTLIFVTNMAQFAVKGYEVNAFDFVVKPIPYYDFVLKLRRGIEHVRFLDTDVVTVNTKSGMMKFVTSRVKYIEIMKHQIIYHTLDGDFLGYGTLKEVEQIFPAEKFVRCSNSYLINLKYVNQVENYFVYIDKTPIPISRIKKKVLMKALSDYYVREF